MSDTWSCFQERTHHRNNAFRRSGGYCNYCLAPVSKRKSTLDHVVPVVAGGTVIMNGEINVVMACGLCNRFKSSMPLAQFLASPWLKERIRLVAKGTTQEPPGWRTAYCKKGEPRRKLVIA